MCGRGPRPGPFSRGEGGPTLRKERSIRRTSVALRWIARLGGTALLVVFFSQGTYEFSRLVAQKWVYGERIFSAAFLGMLLGTMVGWRNDRLAAALLMAGYVLTAATLFLADFARPMLGADAGAVAARLLPFLIVGLVYARAGRIRRVWD